MNSCARCGKETLSAWLVCPHCGAAVTEEIEMPPLGPVVKDLKKAEPSVWVVGSVLTFVLLTAWRFLVQPPLWLDSSFLRFGLSLTLAVPTIVALAGYGISLLRQTLERPELAPLTWSKKLLRKGGLVSLVGTAFTLLPFLFFAALAAASYFLLVVVANTSRSSAALSFTVFILIFVSLILVGFVVMVWQCVMMPLRLGYYAAFDEFADPVQDEVVLDVHLRQWKGAYYLLILASSVAFLLWSILRGILSAGLRSFPWLVDILVAPLGFFLFLLTVRTFGELYRQWLPSLRRQLSGLRKLSVAVPAMPDFEEPSELPELKTETEEGKELQEESSELEEDSSSEPVEELEELPTRGLFEVLTSQFRVLKHHLGRSLSFRKKKTRVADEETPAESESVPEESVDPDPEC